MPDNVNDIVQDFSAPPEPQTTLEKYFHRARASLHGEETDPRV